MRIGYARVSTEDQTLDLQKDTLKRAKCREIYEEQASGKNTGRPQLEGCLKSLRAGDTLVVWRLDRLGRNLADLVRLIAELEQRKINFESLTEKIETRSPSGRLVRALLKIADVPVAEIATRFGIARSTLYRAVIKPAA
jgi:DNA invertase Pin-like site-specific DNA recombinase